jgi:transcriptional regulator with XRE-family HTH domain
MEYRYTRLREKRLAAGITDARFAKLAGVSRPQIWRYERGYNVPIVTTAFRMARILGLTVEDLFGDCDVIIEHRVSPRSREELAGRSG